MKAALQNSYSMNDRQPLGWFLSSVVRINFIGVLGNENNTISLRITPPSTRA